MDNFVFSTATEDIGNFLPPKEVWILGGGKFGLLAVERLGWRYPDANILVVDKNDIELPESLSNPKVVVKNQDAQSYLFHKLLSDNVWIIPAIPIHVVFHWIVKQLERNNNLIKIIPVPRSVDSQVPNPYRSANGSLYTSFATFVCPDNCSEPEGICIYTRKARLGDLFEKVAEITEPDFNAVVIRSFQLAPGVGGYPGEHFHKALRKISERPGNYLVATSCRCHGVINAVEVRTNGIDSEI